MCLGYTPAPAGFAAVGGVTTMPEWLYGLIQAGLTVIALIVIIVLLAALFMIIFGIATGIDDRIQE
jgi:hypothetical protein